MTTTPIEASGRLQKFCDEWAQMGGHDPDMVYGVHLGHDRAAAVTITDLKAMIGLVQIAAEACSAIFMGVEGGLARTFTCSEAEEIAALFRAVWDKESADVWIAEHADGDDDDTDEHHALYLSRKEARS